MTISERMSRIRSKNTGPERAMARLLRGAGIRFRRHQKLPGTPDFRLAGLRVVLFVDGTFWHGRNGWSKLKPFWRKKIKRNVQRDIEVNLALKSRAWIVIRVWEDELESSMPRIMRVWKRESSRLATSSR